MKYIKKFLSSILLVATLTPSLLATSINNEQYVPMRTYAESLGYKVTWQKGIITLENSDAPAIVLNLNNNNDDVLVIKNNTTYVDKDWLSAKLGTNTTPTDYTMLGSEVIKTLLKGDFQTVFNQMSPSIKAQMTASSLAQSWNSIPLMFGKILSFEVSSATPSNDLVEVEVRLQCENTPVKTSIIFDANNEIASLQIAPYPKEMAKPEGMIEQPMVVQTDNYKLPATLTLPNATGSFPVVVLVHGSGPNDRDENIYNTKVFRDIAYGLAKQGIATLRYDKRTYTYMQEVMINPSAFDYEEEVIDDAISAIELIKTVPQINTEQVYVLGHSLGAMSIPMISTKDSGVKGYIMVAGPARNLIDVVLEQLDYLSTIQGLTGIEKSTYMAQMNAQADVVRTLTEDSTLPELNFIGINNRVWADLNAYDQVATAKKMTEPLFIIQGGRDYQVTMEDFNLWKTYLNGQPNVSFKDYPDLNHLLVEGIGKSTPNEYYIPALISEKVVNDISEWIKMQ